MARASRLVFFGSGDLAVSCLEGLAHAGRLPQLIIARRPTGDGDRPRRSPVARWARAHKVEVLEPGATDGEALQQAVAAAKPDLIVDVGYGRPLPAELLELAPLGGVGLHASLLPKYRGAAPIRGALSGGEHTTGVTTFQLDDEPYTGPILLQESTEIGEREVYGVLAPRLAELGSALLVETLSRLGGARGSKKIKPRPQNEKAATEAPRISQRHRRAPWWQGASAVFNRLRAYAPEQGVSSWTKGRPVEVLWGIPLDWEDAPFGFTGTYIGMRQGRLALLCGENSVFGIERLRWPDGEAMSASEFAIREGIEVGDKFT